MQYLEIENSEIVKDGLNAIQVKRIIRSRNPNTSLAKDLSPELVKSKGFYLLNSTDKPDGDVVTEIGPELRGDGEWYQVWDIRYFTQSELDAQLQSNQSPMVVTMRQARLALLQQGLLASIQPAIDALDEPHRSAAIIEWEYSQTVERTRPFVLLLGQALGLTDDNLDALFTLAATL